MSNSGKPSIVFVCTANIIRSPTAEALLKAKFRRHPSLFGWHIASAGIYGVKGEPADETTQTVMRSRGFDLKPHVARSISASLVSQSDLILTMEKGQKEILHSAYSDQKEKIRFIGEIAGTSEDVFDPIGGTREQYESAIENISRLIDKSFLWIIVLAKYHHDFSEFSDGSQRQRLQVPVSDMDEMEFPRTVLETIAEIPLGLKYGILYLLLQILPNADTIRQELELLSREVPPAKDEESWFVRMRLLEIVRPITCLQLLREDKYRHPDIQKKIVPMIGRLENPKHRQLFLDLEQLYSKNFPAFKYRLGIWDLKTKYPDIPFRVGDYEEAYTILRR